jgi:ribosomal protein S1
MSVDPETMEELLAAESNENLLRPLRTGETVEGTVASISGDEATIDLGDRPAGVLAVREAGADQLGVGDPARGPRRPCCPFITTRPLPASVG